MPPAARAAAPTAETPNGLENGFATDEKKSKLLDKLAGNALVLDVEILLALMQQSLHGTQLLDHRNRRDGVSGGFGEAWALADRFDADSGSLASFQTHTARAIYAGGTKQLPGGGAP